MTSELIETWRMSNEANLFLLGKLPRGSLDASYGTRTRKVGGQFAHVHSTRLRWLTHAAPALAQGVDKFEKGAEPTKAQLTKALKASGKAVEAFLLECEEAGKVKKWKGSPTTFLGYLVAHEAHHRGLVMVALRMAGHKLPQEVVYGQWQWGKTFNQRG